jgi:hypothetical protein
MAPHRHDGATGIANSAWILDQNGYMVWFTAQTKKLFDFKYHADHQLYSLARRKNGSFWHYFMNESFNLVDSLTAPAGYAGDIHETQIFPNGNICIIAQLTRQMDLSGCTFAGTQGSVATNVIDLVLLEYDPAHNLMFEWKAMDHSPPDIFSDDFYHNSSALDVVHTNAIELDDDGNLLISCRMAEAIIKINRTTSAVMRISGENDNQ